MSDRERTNPPLCGSCERVTVAEEGQWCPSCLGEKTAAPMGGAVLFPRPRSPSAKAEPGDLSCNWRGGECDQKVTHIFLSCPKHAAKHIEAERMGQASPELAKLRAEVEMLRGVGCNEDGDGPCGACLKCAIAGRHVAQRSANPQVTPEDWDALCATAPKDHPEHWAFVFLALAINHLGAALVTAGVDPNAHADEQTVPNEDRANLQEVWCAWNACRGMIKEIGKLAVQRTKVKQMADVKDAK